MTPAPAPPPRIKDYKIQNITPLPMGCSVQQYHRWISDLGRAHAAMPNSLGNDTRKVIHALENTEQDCRRDWDTHVTGLRSKHPGTSVEDHYVWDDFMEFTKNFQRDPNNSTGTITDALNNAYQKIDQSPREFNQYLETLEFERLPLRPEEDRADLFLSRLEPWFRAFIRTNNINHLPQTRHEMVQLAQATFVGLPKSLRSTRRSEIKSPDQHKPLFDKKPRTEANSSKNHKTDNRFPSRYQPAVTRGDSGRRSNTSPRTRTNDKPNSSTNNRRSTTKSTTDNKSYTPPGEVNPLSADGKPKTCYACGSDRHYSNECPDKGKPASTHQTRSHRRPAVRTNQVQGHVSEEETTSESA